MILRTDFLEDRQLSVEDLAAAIDVPATQIAGILSGRRAVTGDMAMRESLPEHGKARVKAAWP